MNERIKALVEQSGYTEGYYESDGGPWVDPEFNKEKFTRLILKECIRACGSVQEQFFNGRIATDDFNLKNRFAEGETACDMVQTKIEMIFGIE